jgi:hypothetical protein
MKAELTAIIETAPEGGFWAICPEVPGANGHFFNKRLPAGTKPLHRPGQIGFICF